mgnify:CR=1 FL=1
MRKSLASEKWILNKELGSDHGDNMRRKIRKRRGGWTFWNKRVD